MRHAIAILVAASIAGCSERAANDPAAPAQTTVALGQAMVEGFEYLAMHVKAERFDPVTRELHDVRVVGRDGALHAARAVIVIDPATETITLELHDVVTADTGNENEPGTLRQFDRIVLDPVPLDGSTGSR